MPDKIKISIGVLAVIALISFLSFVNSLGIGKMPTLATVLGQAMLGPIEDDIDGDGLFNSEESYWNTDFQNPDTDGDGFLDGEEIKSGHDPIVAGPDDILLSQENMTQRMSQLAVAGIYTGNLDMDNPNFESSLSVLTNTIVDETLEEFVKDIDPARIMTVASNQQNQSEYIKDMKLYLGSLAQAHADQLTSLSKFAENKNGSKLSESLTSANQKLKETIKELYTLEVPDNWRVHHLNIMAWAASLAGAGYSMIEVQEDPIKASIAMTTLINGHIDLAEITSVFYAQARTLGLQ